MSLRIFSLKEISNKRMKIKIQMFGHPQTLHLNTKMSEKIIRKNNIREMQNLIIETLDNVEEITEDI